MSTGIKLFTCLFIPILFNKPDTTLSHEMNREPSFSRRMAEEIDDQNRTIMPCTMHEDSQSHLVSVFVKNVRQLFDEFDEKSKLPDNYTIPISRRYSSDEIPTTTETTISTIIDVIKPFRITEDFSSIVRRSSGITEDLPSAATELPNITVDTTKTGEVSEDNLTFETVALDNTTTKITVAENNITTTTEEIQVPDVAKDVIILGKTDDPESDNNDIGQYEPPTSTTTLMPITSFNKSCISCNNIELEDCTDPTNKLVPSIACQHEDDVCYSMHTPFGIVERGCFNVKYNETVYVCSCNLCNYIPVTELPHNFSHKKAWVENVIEQSHTLNFKKSFFKDMTCVSCEVNATSIDPNVQDNNNCYEGNAAILPTRECEEYEICGIRHISKEGYLWRGCLRSPLYNFWWSFCDTDLCNYEPRANLFDYLT